MMINQGKYLQAFQARVGCCNNVVQSVNCPKLGRPVAVVNTCGLCGNGRNVSTSGVLCMHSK